MSKERMEEMFNLYKDYNTGENLIAMIAELRDSFLDHDLVSKQIGYDIAELTPTGPDHVIYYIAEYISILEKQAERVQELEEESYNAHLERLLDRKEQQNKHYRVVIKKAIDDLENECLWDALVALKALEGESND